MPAVINPHPHPQDAWPAAPWERTHAMWTQLSMAAVFAPGVGHVAAIVLTLVLWLAKRDTSAFVDDHGREVLNFQISYLIYLTVSAILIVAGIGIVLLIALHIITLIAVIRAARAAHDGRLFRYPLCLRFLR